jgi:hypothetical protein
LIFSHLVLIARITPHIPLMIGKLSMMQPVKLHQQGRVRMQPSIAGIIGSDLPTAVLLQSFDR